MAATIRSGAQAEIKEANEAFKKASATLGAAAITASKLGAPIAEVNAQYGAITYEAVPTGAGDKPIEPVVLESVTISEA